MPVDFVPWNPTFLPLHKRAYEFLSSACKRSRLSVFTPEDVISQAKRKQLSIYLVIVDGEIIGCFTLSLRPARDDLYLELPLLGGKRLKEWRDELVKFLFEQAEAHECTRFTMIGRKGFEKLFPEIKLLCCVYGRNLT